MSYTIVNFDEPRTVLENTLRDVMLTVLQVPC